MNQRRPQLPEAWLGVLEDAFAEPPMQDLRRFLVEE